MRFTDQVIYCICFMSVSGTLLKSFRSVISGRQRPGGRQKNFITPPFRGLNASRVLVSSPLTMNRGSTMKPSPSLYLSSKFGSDILTDSSIQPSLTTSNMILGSGILSEDTFNKAISLASSPAVTIIHGLIKSNRNQISEHVHHATDKIVQNGYSVKLNRTPILSTMTIWKSSVSKAFTDAFSTYSDSKISFISSYSSFIQSHMHSSESISNSPIETPLVIDKTLEFTKTVFDFQVMSSALLSPSQTVTSHLKASATSTIPSKILIKPTPTFTSDLHSITSGIVTARINASSISLQKNRSQSSKYWSVNLSDDFLLPSSFNTDLSVSPPIFSRHQERVLSTVVLEKQSVSSMLFSTISMTTTAKSPVKASTSISSSSKGQTNGSSSPAGHNTCAQIRLNFPESIEMDESEPVGSVLASIPFIAGSANVTFSVIVKEPMALTNIMAGYFDVDLSFLELSLKLFKSVDIEQLYHLTGKTVLIQNLLLEVQCKEILQSSIAKETVSINMTIWDEDDEMPRFQNQENDEKCVIPTYKADASEDYMGELTTKPGKIKAVDGDLFIQHNISYAVMHAEPDNYDAYFYLNTVDGSVNKTKVMNASDPRKYILFIQAVEDSPQQKKRVAVLSIEVFAPSDPIEDYTHTVDPTVKLSLKVISALVILGFASGLIVIAHHRWRRKRGRIYPDKGKPYESAYEVKPLELAVYCSSSSSLECEPTKPVKTKASDQPSVSSPSQIQVIPSMHQSNNKTKRRVIVKKPIDTKLRPGWNAPPRKKKPVVYSPYNSVKTK